MTETQREQSNISVTPDSSSLLTAMQFDDAMMQMDQPANGRGSPAPGTAASSSPAVCLFLKIKIKLSFLD